MQECCHHHAAQTASFFLQIEDENLEAWEQSA
jgi:hypothetical protein